MDAPIAVTVLYGFQSTGLPYEFLDLWDIGQFNEYVAYANRQQEKAMKDGKKKKSKGKTKNLDKFFSKSGNLSEV